MSRGLQEQRIIINSKPFRRLADKTQVVTSTERNAQIRTRLTHSLEVASIAQEIAFKIKKIKDYTIDPTIVYNVSLLHDLGMAPLGHLGESSLNDIANELFGLHFEANANNISVILDKLGYISPLTIVSTIKYPYLIKENEKGKGLYEKQYNTYKPILIDTITVQNQIPNIERERTYECDIMELSDDLAYLFSDFEDYIALTSKDKRISKNELIDLFDKFKLNNVNVFNALVDALENDKISVVEDLRNDIIDDIVFDENLNEIRVMNEDNAKLMKIIRYIDWHYYIDKFSLKNSSNVIQDYKKMLEFVFSNIRNEEIVKDFIYSSSKLKAYLKSIKNEDSDQNLAKILIMSMAELTDTYALQLIELHKSKYQ